jgi:hypothetical protein
MKEFLLIFRRDYRTKELQPTTEQMDLHLLRWRRWFLSLAEEGKLARPVQRWDPDGRVLRKNMTVTTGSYADGQESMRGMIIIKAADYEHAVAIAQRAPVLELGGTVEVRMAV